MVTIFASVASRLLNGIPGSLFLLAVFAIGYSGMHLFSAVVTGSAGLGDIGVAARDSALSTVAGYTPFGLLAGVFAAPSDSSMNAVRLSGLLAALAVVLTIEWHVLLRSCQGGATAPSVMAATVPVVRILRRFQRLSPSAVLGLVETECLLRFRPARLCVLACFAYGLVHAVRIPTLGLPFAVFMLCVLMHGMRSVPATCYVWRESLTFPLTAVQVLRTPVRSSEALASVLLAGTTSVMVWSSRGGWLVKGTSLGLALATVLFVSGCVGVVQAYWPPRRTDPNEQKLEIGPDVAGMLALVPALAMVAVAMGLYVAEGRYSVSPGVGPTVAAMCMVVASATWYLARKWQARLLRRRGCARFLREDMIRGGS